MMNNILSSLLQTQVKNSIWTIKARRTDFPLYGHTLVMHILQNSIINFGIIGNIGMELIKYGLDEGIVREDDRWVNFFQFLIDLEDFWRISFIFAEQIIIGIALRPYLYAL